MIKDTVVFSLLDSPAFGGAEQYMFSQLYFLSKNGYKILLATNNTKVKKEILSRLTSDEKICFKIITAPYRLDAIGNWKGLIKYFFSLPKALLWFFYVIKNLKKNYKNIICLFSGFSDRLSFSPMARYLGCKLIWIEIGPLAPIFKKNFGFPKILYKLTAKFPNHLITTSEFTKNSILKNTNFKKDNITLIYPGTKLFSEKEIKIFLDKGKIWKKNNNSEKVKLIGVVARLAPENEISMVINALNLYLRENKKEKLLLLIIGDGDERGNLKKLVENLEIKKYIRFTGFINEDTKRIFLSSCDFFIFPRAWELEGFGMTTIEAMSLGIPVLTTNFGPQIEIIRDGIEGFRYLPHDSWDLKLKMEKILNLSIFAKNALSKNALSRVKIFSEDKAHKKILSVLKQTMSLLK